jgi:hypothetical protein
MSMARLGGDVHRQKKKRAPAFPQEGGALESWEKRIEGILDRSPTRAMSLSRLLEAVRAQSFGPVGSRDQILSRMKEESGRFKVVPDRLGPWAHLARPGRTAGRSEGEGPQGDPWILIKSPPQHAMGSEGRVVGQVQESLLAWGQGLDTDSQRAVARWIDANWEAQEVLSSLFTPGARGF